MENLLITVIMLSLIVLTLIKIFQLSSLSERSSTILIVIASLIVFPLCMAILGALA